MTIFHRIAALYTAAAQGREAEPAGATGVRELYEMDRRYRSSEWFDADRAYWAGEVAGVRGATTLSTVDGPPAAANRCEIAPLSDAATALLLGSRRPAAAAATIIAALACYVSRMTGCDEVVLNAPVSARTTPEARRAGGMMVNVVPLRLRVRTGDTVGELVQRVQHTLKDALEHQRCGIEDIRREVGGVGTQRFAGPVVNVLLFFHALTLGSLTGEVRILTYGPERDLSVNVYPVGSPPRVVVDMRANPNRYGGAELRTHHRRFVALLEEFLGADSTSAVAAVHPETARLGGEVRQAARQLGYWREVLAGVPEVLELPLDRPRPAVRSLRGGRVEFGVDAAVHRRVCGLARAHRASVFMMVHAVLAVLLARLSGGADVAVGRRWPVAGRWGSMIWWGCS